MSKKIYDYDKCYDIAKQCSTSTEMQKMNGSAYNVARKNDWLKDYVSIRSSTLTATNPK